MAGKGKPDPLLQWRKVRACRLCAGRNDLYGDRTFTDVYRAGAWCGNGADPSPVGAGNELSGIAGTGKSDEYRHRKAASVRGRRSFVTGEMESAYEGADGACDGTGTD